MLTGAFGWAWELLARQAPSSPWNVGGFPDEIARFALHAWIIGLALATLAPRALASPLLGAQSRARLLLVAAYVGAALTLIALAYSARTGLLGLQVRESTRPAHTLLVMRLCGEAMLFTALVVSIVAIVRAERKSD